MSKPSDTLVATTQAMTIAAATRQATADIIIFDQAFVQATCTLALNSCGASNARLEKAIRQAPKADLIIRLNAPREMLKSRLEDRLRRVRRTILRRVS